ncbi:M23 family metallopeptidase [Ruania rhizosphaerae]|uniref:M23 family metallopeptidase n=1 Tax=Ruania rhizosphaerae TaxID=1840413 RepID=UPI00190F223E|nr:peptidoglycan DD-metalloendopeptidase family protein [Ruania rhizosphaerae]
MSTHPAPPEHASTTRHLPARIAPTDLAASSGAPTVLLERTLRHLRHLLGVRLMLAFLLVLTSLVTLTAGSGYAVPAAGRATGELSPPGTWTWPIQPPPLDPADAVVRGFDPPPAPWAAGHRGVDIATAAGAGVHAAGSGEVTFAGVVVDRPLVVVEHPGGLRTTYEPVRPDVQAGDVVGVGELIGTLAAGGHCSGCLHWGLRNAAGVYLDPMQLLTPVQIRLYPVR